MEAVITRTTKEHKTIGIREFRDHLARHLESDTPITITRHGDTIGIYLPVRRKRSEEDWDALLAAHEALQKEMERAGVTEDDILEDYERIKRERRG